MKSAAKSVAGCADRIIRLVATGATARRMPPTMRWATPIAELIVQTREVYAIDGSIMQVLRRIPSGMDAHHDVVLFRSYLPPAWNPAPFVTAIQFRTLERLVEDDAVSFPIGLGKAARDFSRDWPPAAISALEARVCPPSH